jgi:hypothetical protein
MLVSTNQGQRWRREEECWARLNVATSCSARKDDARRIALILVVGAVGIMERGVKMMLFVLEFAPSQVVALLSTYILKLNFVMLWVRLINPVNVLSMVN